MTTRTDHDRAELIRRLEDAKTAEALRGREYRNARANTNQAILDAHDHGIDDQTICATVACHEGRLEHALASRTARTRQEANR